MSGNSGKQIYSIFILLLSLTCVIAANISSDLFILTGGISLILFFAFCIVIYKSQQYFFFLVLPFLFPQFTAIVSNFSLETGAYIEELKVNSYATGGATRLVFFVLSFFFVALLVFRVINKYRINRFYFILRGDYSKLERQVIFCSASLIFIVLAFNVVVWGSPLFKGVQRFDYWSAHPYPSIRNLLYQGYLLSFILGVYITKTKITTQRKSVPYILLVLTFCLFNILYGEKFTGVFLTMLYFFVGLFGSLVLYKNITVITKKNVFFVLIVGLLLYGLIYYQYKYIHHLPGSIFSFIESRVLNLQGEVWWAIDGKDHQSGALSYLYTYNSDCTLSGGLYYLMYQIAPTSMVDSYCQRGITFTMGYPAILLPTAGYFGGYLLNLIFASLVGITLFLIKKSIEYPNVISLFLSAKVLLIETHALNMGNIYNILDMKFFLYFLLLIFFSELRLKNAQIGSHVPASIPSGQTK